MEFVIWTPDTITLDKPVNVFSFSKSDCDEVFLMRMLLQTNLLIVWELHSSHLYLLVQAYLKISCCRSSMRRMNVRPKMTNRPKACQHTMNGWPLRTLRHFTKNVKWCKIFESAPNECTLSVRWFGRHSKWVLPLAAEFIAENTKPTESVYEWRVLWNRTKKVAVGCSTPSWILA